MAQNEEGTNGEDVIDVKVEGDGPNDMASAVEIARVLSSNASAA